MSSPFLGKPVPLTKACLRCGEVKPIAEFARHGASLKGITRWNPRCKPCVNARKGEAARRLQAEACARPDWPTCACGCGQPVPAAPYNEPRKGWVKGAPLEYRKGHHLRDRNPSRLEGHVVTASGCWEPIGRPMESSSYRQRRVNGKKELAHRQAYIDAHGPIPAGYHVHHECENPACVNVAHLELLEHGEHTRRHHKGTKFVDGRYVRAAAAPTDTTEEND